MRLPAPLYHQLRSILRDCGHLQSDQALRSTFVTDKLAPWRDRLPQADNEANRIDFLIANLSNRTNVEGENALVLFVEALRDKTDEQDSCHQRLAEAAAALRDHVGQPASGAVPQAPPWTMTGLVQDALQLLDEHTPETLARLPAGERVGVRNDTLVDVWEKGRHFTAYFIAARDPETGRPRAGQDLALVADVTQLTVRSAAEHLDEQGIAAHLVLFTNRPGYDRVQFLDADDVTQWEEPMRQFAAVRAKSQRDLGTRRAHVFLALPVVIAFGLGAVWGTVDAVRVYHWKRDGSGYMPIDVSAAHRG